MISKELFCRTLDHMEQMDEMSEELNNIFENNNCYDFRDGAMFIDLELQNLTIQILQEAIEDELGTIEWWVCDTHFGKSDPVVVENGKIINLYYSEDLYDFLTNS